jgi:hypothetical protein
MTTNLLAARFVTRNATSAAEARKFLDMLGLVDDAGRITPDETRSLPLEVPAAAVADRQPTSVQWWTDKPEVSTAPEALRNLPPLVARPTPAVKVKRPVPDGLSQAGNIRRMAPCGTELAARRHVRHREPLCETCAQGRAERAKPSPDKKPKLRPVRSVPECGTQAGYERHRRRHERPCDQCRATERARSTERRIEARGGVAAEIRIAKCGTSPGLKRHYRLKETPCVECKAYKKEHDRAYHERKKARAA